MLYNSFPIRTSSFGLDIESLHHTFLDTLSPHTSLAIHAQHFTFQKVKFLLNKIAIKATGMDKVDDGILSDSNFYKSLLFCRTNIFPWDVWRYGWTWAYGNGRRHKLLIHLLLNGWSNYRDRDFAWPAVKPSPWPLLSPLSDKLATLGLVIPAVGGENKKWPQFAPGVEWLVSLSGR